MSSRSPGRRTRFSLTLPNCLLCLFYTLLLFKHVNSSQNYGSSLNRISLTNTQGQQDGPGAGGVEDIDVFTDQFVAHISGGPQAAKLVAGKHGFVYLGQIFDDTYHLRHHKISKRSLAPFDEGHSLTDINNEHHVHSLKQQTLKSRSKRDFLQLAPSSSFARASSSSSSSSPSSSSLSPSPSSSSSSNVSSSSPDHTGHQERFNDPRYGSMWYLNRGQGLDMNVEAVWRKGITGKGVVVTILDDGLEKTHPDLMVNYDPEASYDVNNHDEDPMPRYDMIDSNRHGTRCAGEVAADANNSICAVGIAYNSRIGGVRMLDGDVTDAVEARSLSLNPQHIQIYSASWGPDDDGRTVDGPGELATRAFVDGVTKGRNGLGSIFVWASGNGGREHDNCNCDGYTNSIWTLSISSATENGLVPWYSEACSSTLATTYSSGSFGERQIITTDLHHGCTSSHTGTSASAPLAAGICALALEANPKLSWRDMQHIVVQTAHPANLHARDWLYNKVTGRNVSHSFGFGLMDADAMVETAKDWVTVPVQKTCDIQSHPIDKLIPAKSHVELSLLVSCDNVRFLEHVQAKVTLTATRRGDMHIYLTSPSGTRSTLLAQRPMDNSRSGFQNWPFMTVHSWGENPNGVWKLEVHNEGRYYSRAYLKEWSLTMYGTTSNPDRRKRKHKRPSTPAPLITPSIVHRGNSGTSPKPTKFTLAGSGALTTPASVRLLPTQQQTSHHRVPFVDMDHNDLEDDVHPELTLSDSHRKAHKQEYPAIHGTRADKSEDHHQRSSDDSAAINAGCTLRGSSFQCLACTAAFYLIHGRCVITCPDGYYESKSMAAPEGDEEQVGGMCLRCHYTCKQCSKRTPSNCTSCYPDAQLFNDGRCHDRDLVEEVTGLEQWYTAVTAVFLCLCLVILVLVVYIMTEKYPQVLRCCFATNKPSSGSGSALHHRSSLRQGSYDGYDDLPLNRGRQARVMNLAGSAMRQQHQIKTTTYRDDLSEDDL